MKATRFVRRVVLFVVVLSGIAIALFYFAPHFLPEAFFDVSQDPVPAQMIVLLGGDLRQRLPKTIDLYEKGFADRVLISGAAPGQTASLKKAVPPERLQVESLATSTWENAVFSRPLLDSKLNNGDTILLVTDSWHTRRVLACFQKACPHYRFVPVAAEAITGPYFDPETVKRREFSALLFYVFRYRVSPWKQ